jgi:uncharacterized OsmC-like protein
MRNGLNIAGVSEVVHEIREKPVEAVITFNTVTRAHGATVETTLKTAHHGTFRMSRDFQLPFSEVMAAQSEMSTLEGAVAALGACVLITHVHGYSARGVSLTSFRLRVSACVDVDDQGRWIGGELGLRDLRYVIEVDGEGAPELLSQVTQFVTCFSPNHRVFLDEASYELTGEIVGPAGATTTVPVVPGSPPALAPSGRQLDVTAELQWEYGTEANVTTDITPGGDKRGRSPRFVVDQSKQMLGIDRGPNPQELLLAAISAELVMQMGQLARQRDLPVADVEVNANGRLDIRGMLNVDKDIPARFHQVRFQVCAQTPLDPAAVGELMAECAARNVLLHTLRMPNSVQVELNGPDRQLLSFTSDAAQVTAFLAEIARMQAEQAAADALTMASN